MNKKLKSKSNLHVERHNSMTRCANININVEDNADKVNAAKSHHSTPQYNVTTTTCISKLMKWIVQIWRMYCPRSGGNSHHKPRVVLKTIVRRDCNLDANSRPTPESGAVYFFFQRGDLELGKREGTHTYHCHWHAVPISSGLRQNWRSGWRP